MPSSRKKTPPVRDAADDIDAHPGAEDADLQPDFDHGFDSKFEIEFDRAAPPSATNAPQAVYVDRSRPSKTALKNRMTELQKLGEAVAALPDDRLAALALPESLFDAIVQWRRTRSFEGRRRQMQYVGKLMRQVDEAPLQQAVAEYTLGSARETLLLHRVEQWRAALVTGDDAVTEWMRDHPATDVQRLRQLVRRARSEQAEQAQKAEPTQRQGRAFRDLFQMIKPALMAAESAPEDTPQAEDDA